MHATSYWKYVIKLNFVVLSDQNFLFNQGRFIPSFQNPRNGFFPTAGDSSSYRQQQLQNVPASGYLNAQSLFKGSELPYTTEGYFPYSAVPVSVSIRLNK